MKEKGGGKTIHVVLNEISIQKPVIERGGAMRGGHK
jgi:hypothetical protein